VRVTMLALGSRGDAQPFIAFGLGLKRAGYDVRLATYPRFESLATDRGLEFAPLAEGSLSRGKQTADGRRWTEQDRHRLPTWVGFVRDARSVAHRRLADAAAACEDSDVIVASNLAQVVGWQMADHFGVPLVRTLYHAPTYWMTRRSNRPLAALVRQAAWLAARPWLNAVRREALGLPKLPLREPIGELDRSGALALHPFSLAVFPKPPGWGEWAEVTGYWFLDGSLDPDPPNGLAEFIATGTPPVYVGFGTQADDDVAGTAAMAAEALRRIGRRGVILTPPGVSGDAALGTDTFGVEAVSHTWLFPRCAAVVHHSASGTTAAGLRAGVPTVAVPHNTDQFSWARRIHELGVGPKPIPRRKLTLPLLEAAIRTATGDDAIGRRAAELGERIRAEDGVARAVEAFIRHVGAPPAPLKPVGTVVGG
jgi:sterol 3beta-glucosyltransferase